MKEENGRNFVLKWKVKFVSLLLALALNNKDTLSCAKALKCLAQQLLLFQITVEGGGDDNDDYFFL